MSKVRVIGDETGNVINQSATNPDYGYVRLEQVKTTIDDNGFLRRRSISTLVQGLVSDLKAENYFSGQELSGKIVILEAITPFNKRILNVILNKLVILVLFVALKDYQFTEKLCILYHQIQKMYLLNMIMQNKSEMHLMVLKHLQ